MTGIETMPATGKPSKDKRSIGLTPDIWEQLERLAEQNGNETVTDTVRRCILLGISQEKERLSADLRFENSQLVNRKLKMRESDIREALASLADPASSQEDRLAALDLIQSRLTD